MGRPCHITLASVEQAIQELKKQHRTISGPQLRKHYPLGGIELLRVYIELVKMKENGCLSRPQIDALLRLELDPKSKRLRPIEGILGMRFDGRRYRFVSLSKAYKQLSDTKTDEMSPVAVLTTDDSHRSVPTSTSPTLIKPLALRPTSLTLPQFAARKVPREPLIRVPSINGDSIGEPMPTLYIDGSPFMGFKTYVSPSCTLACPVKSNFANHQSPRA